MAETLTGPPKLLVLDIDGTLIAPGRKLTGRVRQALLRAERAGCPVVLATGRASFEVTELFAETGLADALAVCSNGAVVARMPSGQILAKEHFDARPVLSVLLEHLPSALVAVELAGHGYAVTQRFPDGEMIGRQLVGPIEELIAEPVTRVVVRDPDQSSQDFHELTRRLNIRGASYSVGYRAWLDLGPAGVSKASGLRTVSAMLAVEQRDVLAIGDGHNDLELIAWAGRGVAMGQAPAELKLVADGVTGSVTEDGVATEIEKWF
jgi:Cof subfamily protein (haloacid dehalogenase superfamily)